MRSHPGLRHPLIMVAVIFVAAFFIGAPAGSQPEKLSNAQPDWDSDSQAFVIGFKATASLADRAGAEGYQLSTALTIFDRAGNRVDTLEPPVHPMRRVEAQQGRGQVMLTPQVVPWDRIDGTFAGLAEVHLRIEVQTSTGVPIDVFSDVLIGPIL